MSLPEVLHALAQHEPCGLRRCARPEELASARNKLLGGWVHLGCAGVPKTPQVDVADQQPVRLLQVCGTTPCMLQGARKIYAAIKERLGIDYGETTPVGDDGCCRVCGWEAKGSRGLWLGCAAVKPVAPSSALALWGLIPAILQLDAAPAGTKKGMNSRGHHEWVVQRAAVFAAELAGPGYWAEGGGRCAWKRRNLWWPGRLGVI